MNPRNTSRVPAKVAARPQTGKISDEQVRVAMAEHGSFRAAASALGLSVGTVFARAKGLGLSGKHAWGTRRERRPYVSRATGAAEQLKKQAAARRTSVVALVERLGSQSAAARELGISRQAVGMLVRRARLEHEEGASP